MDFIEFNKDELRTLHKLIGDNVARVRKAHNISQLELALTIGYKSTSVIAKAEAGTEGRHFSIEQLYKIAVALNVDLAEFFKNIKCNNESERFKDNR